MSDFRHLLTNATALIDPSRLAELLGDAAALVDRDDLQERAVNRVLNRRYPLPTTSDSLDPEALALASASITDINRCALALSCLPRAGKVSSTADGRFVRAIRGTLSPDDRAFVDSFAGDPNLPESCLVGVQWHNEPALLYGGLQGLLMGMEFGENIAARFCLRFPSTVFDVEPSVMLKTTPIVRQLCRKILQLDLPS